MELAGVHVEVLNSVNNIFHYKTCSIKTSAVVHIIMDHKNIC